MPVRDLAESSLHNWIETLDGRATCGDAIFFYLEGELHAGELLLSFTIDKKGHLPLVSTWHSGTRATPGLAAYYTTDAVDRIIPTSSVAVALYRADAGGETSVIVPWAWRER